MTFCSKENVYKGEYCLSYHSFEMASSSVHNQQIADFNNVGQYMYETVFPAIYIVGNIGNLLSILIFSKKSWKKNVCVFYLKFFILVNTCYINSNILANIFINGFQTNLLNSSIILCKLYTYVSYSLVCLSPTVLILASIDRLLISSQKVDRRLYSSKRLAYFSLSINTFFWCAANTHAVINISVREIFPSYFLCSFISSRIYTDFVTYLSAVLNVTFCLVMIALCAVSFKNVRRIRAVPREKRNQQIRTMNKKDFQLLRCLFVQDLVYICFSMLAILFSVYQAVTRDQTRTAWDRALLNLVGRLVNVLYTMYFASSFFISVIVSRAFRLELKRLIYKIIGKNVNPIREEENQFDTIAKDNAELNVVAVIVLPV